MHNIAQRLRQAAQQTPDKPAVVLCKGRTAHRQYTFAELERDSDEAARGMAAMGIGRGTKTLIMLRPSLAFFSGFFALFKIGAVPVFIDPGMGGARLLECVRVLAPQAMLGIGLAHLVRVFRPSSFPGFKYAITDGVRWLWGGKTWRGVHMPGTEPFPIAEPDPDELAAILFTTGSTGPAKGVEYSHAALCRQADILSDVFSITPDDKDCATFPGFSLFSIALGMTAVVPDMDPVHPAHVDPRNVLGPIQELGCTFSFGSPALWGRVSQYAFDRKIRLPSLKRVVMAGAPVPAAVHERLYERVLPQGADTYTPYGATECMPVACLCGAEALADTARQTADGKGVCVGRPAAGVRVEIITITDDPIRQWSEELAAPRGTIGEIVVRADHASRHYHNLPDADAGAKIADGDAFWHRMGDTGYVDDKGRIWFCGRKAHRVRTADGDMFTLCCEAVFNRHAAVRRSALVGIPAAGGFQTPVIVIELSEHKNQQDRMRRELLELAQTSELTKNIRTVLFHPGFPVDIRHNAKIRREELAVWAQTAQ